MNELVKPIDKYRNLFGRLPVIGMLHLAGEDPVQRALQELSLFAEEGVSAALIENYHGSLDTVIQTLQEISQRRLNVHLGINILPNKFRLAFPFAVHYGAALIQMDHVAGKYDQGELDMPSYRGFRESFSDIFVLGGVWPKYYQPVMGSDLEKDLQDGMDRADAIVVTGAGTGKETPLEKINQFRALMGTFPLVVGAGSTPENAYTQLQYADGAIVGTSLKFENKTSNPVDRVWVRDFMDVVKEVRAYQEQQEASSP
ncbi:MAG: BtpA/SgcQ family protein [Nanoarchaeota archaeon]|nr:BtpA/SgcQ family protein [Nanoarchaeota archaeon]